MGFAFYSPKGFAPKTTFVRFDKTTRVEDGADCILEMDHD